MALCLLALLYAAVVLLGDPRAASGSDAGGKLATVAHMSETGSWDPDVGYWAVGADPEGDLHPLIKTTRYGERWVQVTSLPMIYAAVPLWGAGGASATLVLPAAGGLLAAWGARRLALVLGASSGWGAFWLVGAASPVVFYVADLWEHAVSLGLAMAAVPVLVDPRGRRLWQLVGAGALLGAAASMRAELALYVVAFGIVGFAVAEVRRRWMACWKQLGAAGVAFVGVVFANSLLERSLLSAGVQSSRVGSQLGSVGSDPLERAEDAVLTTFGLVPYQDLRSVLIGVAFVVGLGMVGRELRGRRDRRSLQIGSALVALGVIVRVGEGTGFVPGSLASAPMAPAGVVNAAGASRRLVVGAALVAMPIVWALQWQGDLIAQWGGRYTLLTAVLLTVVAAVAAEEAGWRQPATVVLVAVSVGVSAMGVAWHVERTSAVGEAFDTFEAMAEDTAFVTWFGHLPREGGSWYTTQDWLRADREDVGVALDVAAATEVGRIALVEPDVGDLVEPEPLPGFRISESTEVPWLGGIDLRTTVYERTER